MQNMAKLSCLWADDLLDLIAYPKLHNTLMISSEIIFLYPQKLFYDAESTTNEYRSIDLFFTSCYTERTINKQFNQEVRHVF